MEYILQMENIHKIYPNGTIANKGVNLQVKEGEIHALVGENGAGKSTLMKILFGLEQQTDGRIILKGEELHLKNTKQAIALGLGMVHQHFMLAPSLTVSENIVLGAEPRKGPLKLFRNRKEEYAQVEEIMEQFGLKVDLHAFVKDISVGQKQRVEILKVLYRGAKLIILDEPTAVLTPQETDELFASIKKLTAQGYTIIFITHKLREVMTISDRITVLKAGQTITTLETTNTTTEEISRNMVGRDVLLKVDKTAANPTKAVLSVRHIHYVDEFQKTLLNDVSFDVRAGEIVGIAGVEGNGQTEIVEIITGMLRATNGTVYFDEKQINHESINDIRNMKIAHVPEDRQSTGACLTATINENIMIDHYNHSNFSTGPFLKNKHILQHSEKLIQQYDVRVSSAKQLAGALSGGNLQKVIIARELSKKPRLLIASQPTRGVDIGAIEFIHNEIIQQRDEGAAVLVVSAELSEVLSLSDRIIVMYNGEITANLVNHAQLTEEELGYYMLGVKKQESGDLYGRESELAH